MVHIWAERFLDIHLASRQGGKTASTHRRGVRKLQRIHITCRPQIICKSQNHTYMHINARFSSAPPTYASEVLFYRPPERKYQTRGASQALLPALHRHTSIVCLTRGRLSNEFIFCEKQNYNELPPSNDLLSMNCLS